MLCIKLFVADITPCVLYCNIRSHVFMMKWIPPEDYFGANMGGNEIL